MKWFLYGIHLFTLSHPFSSFQVRLFNSFDSRWSRFHYHSYLRGRGNRSVSYPYPLYSYLQYSLGVRLVMPLVCPFLDRQQWETCFPMSLTSFCPNIWSHSLDSLVSSESLHLNEFTYSSSTDVQCYRSINGNVELRYSL